MMAPKVQASQISNLPSGGKKPGIHKVALLLRKGLVLIPVPLGLKGHLR